MVRHEAGSRDDIAKCRGLIEGLLGFTKKAHAVVKPENVENGNGTRWSTTMPSRTTTRTLA